jgi:hypothetical protein
LQSNCNYNRIATTIELQLQSNCNYNTVAESPKTPTPDNLTSIWHATEI